MAEAFSDEQIEIIKAVHVPSCHAKDCRTCGLLATITTDRKRIEELEAIAGVECYCEYCNIIYHMDNCPDTKLGRVCPKHKTIVWRYRHWQVQRDLNKAEKTIADQTAVIERLKTAIHDCIRRPMGVVPDSAVEFYDQDYTLDAGKEE